MGNANNIFFRSSWELTVMKFFDSNNSVTRWNSEEVHLPYVSPKDNRVHQYYPDFLFEMVNTRQEIERWLVEVKPLKETSFEYAKNLHDKVAVAVNEAKWKAAELFCATHNLKFKVITELDIYKMAPPRPRKPKVSKKKTPGSKLAARTAKKTISKTRKTMSTST